MDGAGTLSELSVQFQETHPAGQSKRVSHFSSPFRDGSLSSDTDHCTIYVQKLEGQKLCLKVRPYDSCLALKRKILAKENIPVAQQRLVFRGRQLQDGLTLYDSNIFDGAVVFLIGPRRVPAPLPPI